MERLRRLAIMGASLAAMLLAAPYVRGDELRGVALVIGLSDYELLADLPNPVNDARAMDALLSDLGFDVSRVLDRGGARLVQEIERFIEDAANADVALVYYSGHGIEAGGENFLVPVDGSGRAGPRAAVDAAR